MARDTDNADRDWFDKLDFADFAGGPQPPGGGPMNFSPPQAEKGGGAAWNGGLGVPMPGDQAPTGPSSSLMGDPFDRNSAAMHQDMLFMPKDSNAGFNELGSRFGREANFIGADVANNQGTNFRTDPRNVVDWNYPGADWGAAMNLPPAPAGNPQAEKGAGSSMNGGRDYGGPPNPLTQEDPLEGEPGQGLSTPSSLGPDPNPTNSANHNNGYAGPSVPLAGAGAPVSPFQDEIDAFNTRNDQAKEHQSWGPYGSPLADPSRGSPPMMPSYDPAGAAIFSATANGYPMPQPGQGLPGGSPLMAPGGGMPLMPPPGSGAPAPMQQWDEPLPFPEEQFYNQQPGFPGNTFQNFPIGSAQNPITGAQMRGLNPTMPANMGGTLSQMIRAEEPLWNAALIGPDDAQFGQLRQAFGSNRIPPPPISRGRQPRR